MKNTFNDALDTVNIQSDSSIPYPEVFAQVKGHCAKMHSADLASLIDDKAVRETLQGIIRNYVNAENLRCTTKKGKAYTLDGLINKLMTDMAGFGFLEELIYDENIEEINGNRWDDIEVIYSGGRTVKYTENKFSDKLLAVDTIKKMLSLHGLSLDESTPDVDAYLSHGTRVSAMIPPVIDDDAAIVFSIRKQTKRKISKNELILHDTASPEELEALQEYVNYGASVIIAGQTSAGKTTLEGHMLANVKGRIFTIEESRELDLIKFDEEAMHYTSSVIHTKVRECLTKEDREISMEQLLKRSLRYNPKYIVPAEMRGAEAYTAVNASLTGHCVITSIHAAPYEGIYDRMAMLCRQNESARAFTDEKLYQIIIRAFPISVFMQEMEKGKRRILCIAEAEGYSNGKIKFNKLFEYDIDAGKHMMKSAPSEKLETMFKRHGKPATINTEEDEGKENAV